MQKFTDQTGRVWIVTIHVGVIEDCRRLLDVDLVGIGGEILQRLESDPVLLCNVLYLICKEQADAAEITDQAFGRLLGGDVIDDAAAAVLESLLYFFPKRRREAIRAAWSRYADLETAATNRITQRINDPAVESAVTANVDRFMDKTLAPMTFDAT